MTRQLECRIMSVSYGNETPDIEYAVFDGDEEISRGVSSSKGWVRHDAGGYHTKKKFDERYPDGWSVNFNF